MATRVQSVAYFAAACALSPAGSEVNGGRLTPRLYTLIVHLLRWRAYACRVAL